MVVANGQGIPLTCRTESASPAEVTLVEGVLEEISAGRTRWSQASPLNDPPRILLLIHLPRLYPSRLHSHLREAVLKPVLVRAVTL